MPKRFGFVVVLVLVGCNASRSQPVIQTGRYQAAQSSVADPTFLERYAVTRRFSAGYPTSIKIVPDGSAVLFLRSPPESFVQDLYEFDTRSGQEKLLLTADKILQGAAENLSPEEKARRERLRMSARGIASYQLSKDGTKLLVPLSGRLFAIERGTGAVTELKSDAGPPLDGRFSPNGKFVSCVRNGDLYLFDLTAQTERALTSGANETTTHGLSEFVAQEEMDRHEGYWWSPDNTMIAFQWTSTARMETMHIMDATHPEEEPQSWPYPRPGKANAEVHLALMDVEERSIRCWVSWDAGRYPYLATVKWTQNAPLTLLVQNREQTEEVLLKVDHYTGQTSTLLVERDDAWLNLDQSMPKWFPNGSAFLWTSERGGHWQLELRSGDGQLIRRLTPPGFPYKGFLHLDDRDEIIYLSGAENTTESHLYKLPLGKGTTAPVRLTTEPGLHSASFGEGHEIYLHSASTLDGRRTQTIRSKDGREMGTLKSIAEEPPFIPKIELTTAGETPSFHAVLIRPRNFDPRKRYPVIVSVYGGPGAQTAVASSRGYLLQQWIADHGFIMVSIDGRGTPNRGRDWERTIRGNFIEAPLADQVTALKALGQKYKELDLDRVGIYGWSFGGYFSAMAVMQRPDLFGAGVAGAPVADWLDYDTHYTERYLGLPDKNPDGYAASSVLTYTKDLSKPLLIIHGTADDNVYFSHSLKMSNELFRAGKDHDFLALSGFTHMVADPLVTTRLYTRIVDFFQEHLQR